MKAAKGLAVAAGALLMGVTPATCKRELTTTTGATEFDMVANDGSRVTGEPRTWQSGPQGRLEIWVKPVNAMREFQDESLGSMQPGSRSSRESGLPPYENEWQSFPAANTPDILKPIDGVPLFLSDEISHAFSYDEGRCSFVIPWHTRDLDLQLQFLEDQVRNNIGGGLADLIITGWDEGLAGAEGTFSKQDVAWFADGFSDFNPIPETRPTQLFMDPQARKWGGQPDNRMCVASYFTTNTHLDWHGDSAGNRAFLGTAGILVALAKLFGIGDCRSHRMSKLTLCVTADVVTAEDLPKGRIDRDGRWSRAEESRQPQAGDLTFRIESVDVKVNDWGKIHTICNNNKSQIEDAIEDVVFTTAAASIGQLADAFSGAFPFRFERCFFSGVGLQCVIAEDADDPDYAGAAALGLCDYKPTMKRGILPRGGWTQ